MCLFMALCEQPDEKQACCAADPTQHRRLFVELPRESGLQHLDLQTYSLLQAELSLLPSELGFHNLAISAALRRRCRD